MIVKDGHEVGHHGYLHEWVDPKEPERELEALEKGLEALHRVVGVRPKGYRSPAGETSHNVFKLLKEKGFQYDSSMLDDFQPYRTTMLDGKPGVIEVPWHWSLDDAIYRSEEHTSELQSLMRISYAVFCLNKQKI